jgi:NDP-sugar pyrophosphorylase family protein
MKYKVLITTSGTGSRLKELTKNKNKALIEINGKPAISYILDYYPEDIEFVITIGYLGEQVQNSLKNLYPKRKFTFVTVDKYEGHGSSLGYSMLAAKEQLQCPFIFHCCDTIVAEKLPNPDRNWTAGFQVDDVSQYRTLNIQENKITRIDDKGINNSNYAHIGLVGIKDYKSFWKNLEELRKANPEDQTLNDTFVINKMIVEGNDFYLVKVSRWYDTGNLEALSQTEKLLRK